MKDKI